MQKQDVRSVLNLLATEASDVSVTVNFKQSSGRGSFSGVLEGVKRGRGKGGSLIAEVKDLEVTRTFGTADSDSVLNISYCVDGSSSVTVGDTEDVLEPVNYSTERNAAQASGLKEVMRQLADTGMHGMHHMVNVVSSVPELNGRFQVDAVRQYRGRVGQVVLTLSRPNVSDEKVMLCSYTHSAVVSELTILD